MNLQYEALPGELSDMGSDDRRATTPDPQEEIEALIAAVLALFPEDTETPRTAELAGVTVQGA